MIRVCITDDHQLVLEGLALLLHGHDDINIASRCQNVTALFEFLETETTDVILLDINLPDMNGIEACKIIKKKYPDVKVIGLSMVAENSLIRLMLKNGADGYLHKNAGKEDIFQAITDVMNGKIYLSREVNELLLGETESIRYANAPFPKLSSRETQILTMIVDEKTTQEISEELFISFGTVETHRRNIMLKLGAKNTAGLVRIALEYKLIPYRS